MKALYKKIKEIEINSTKLANDMLAGSYHSVFKGKGIEFEEVREYQEGDEVRSIDWNVTARMNAPFVKVFREERDLGVTLLVDVSASSRFRQKNALIAEIAAVLAFSAIKNNDRVSLILFSDQVEKFIPPKRNARHVLRIVRELLSYEPKHSGTDLSEALSFFGKVQRQRGICFILSDFICADFSRSLLLLSKKHDMISIGFRDPFERQFPNVGLIHLQDLETGEMALVDSSDKNVRAFYRSEMEKRRDALLHAFKKMGTDYVEILTEEPYLPKLQKFFKMRELKKR